MDDAFRVVNIYATRLRDAKADRSIGALGSVGVPIVDSKWPFGGLASHLRDAGPQCARVVPAEGWAVDPVTVPTESSSVPRAYDVAECRLWLLAIPYTGFVVVLVATARGDEAAAVQLLNDTFFRRARITLGKDAIVDALHPLWAEDARERRADPPPCLDLDLDAHQLLVLRDRRLLQHAGGRLDEGRVRTILFRGERSEPRFSKVMRPVGANRAPGVVVALRVSVSVIAGLEEHLVSGMMVSTAQSVAGLARSRHVRRDAYDALGRVRQIAAAFADSDERSHDGRGDIKTRRTELATRSRRLGAAESELSFGVRANGDIRLLLPVAEVADYHADLATVLDWDAGLATTERLLASLGQTLASARESLAAAERDRDEHFQNVVARAGAALLLPGLVGAYFGANIKGIPGRDHEIGAAWLVGLMLLTAAATWFLLRALQSGALTGLRGRSRGARARSASGAQLEPCSASISSSRDIDERPGTSSFWARS